VRAGRAGLISGVLACLVWAAPAAAFTPPEIYVRLTHANSTDHTPVSDWMPLATAPRLNWLGGYEIGYVFQDAPGSGHPQRAALQITGVPDGQPTQPNNTPYCTGGPGTVGAIVPVGVPIQFEGSGAYEVRVSVGPPSGGPNDCMTGSGTASSTGSFTVDVPVDPAVVGSPLIVRTKPLTGDPFVGVRAPTPAGGEAETRCARDATVNADGSVAGPRVAPPAGDLAVGQIAEGDFVRPGAWTCVARGFVEGYDDNFDSRVFGTPWSVPIQLDVRSDFRRSKGQISKPSSNRPQLRFTAEFPEAAGGGAGKLKVQRLVRCKGKRFVFKTVGTFKGRFDAKGRATLKVDRPREGYYAGSLSFSGTRFYTKSVDPNLVLLRVSDKDRLSFVPRQYFPQCPGFP
jgi:hypothetical protein